MAQLETSGYRGWWEGQEFHGRTRNGVNVVKEVFRNMVTGEVYDPGEAGWNGSPPNPTGSTTDIILGYGGTDEFWEKMAQHRDRLYGTVVRSEHGRTRIVY